MKSPNVSLRRHETLRRALLRNADALIDSVTDDSVRSRNQHQPIHRIRTTIKRLRALLRLIRPAVGTVFFDRENERLRTAARLLSFARDSEVARDTLKALPVSDEFDRRALQAVLPVLEKRVERAKAKEPHITEVKQRLEQTRRSFQQLKFRGTDEEIIETGIRRVYRQGRRRMKTAIQTGKDSAYHRWRIRTKNLYYELQFLEPVWPKQLHRMISRLSKLQDRIGLDHDLIVLRAELEKTPEAFGGREAVQDIVSCIDRQTRKLRIAAEPLGRKIWRQKPRHFSQSLGRHWCKR
ncbi:MAG: CHAD domain-containing protein [Verrucomicrobia bacterium]|nr:CHAD domain-containing protein [Verrucomicrobiota bacterium]